MGCLWALALRPTPVTLLLRDAQTLASYPGVVTLESATAGEPALSVALAAQTVSNPDAAPIRRLLMCCKAQDADAAFASVRPQLADDAVIVIMQNGIRFQRELSRQRPPGTVFCLSTSFGAWRRQPFHIVPAGRGESWLGHLYNTPDADLMLQQLRLELPSARMNIQPEPDMLQRLWQKFAINCAINGLTVMYNCRNGELLSIAAAREHCERLCQEITRLMQALPETPAMPDLWRHVQQVAAATQDNVSSTLQDIRSGRPSEIDHFNGYLCELAERHHLPCPLNREVLSAVLSPVRRAD